MNPAAPFASSVLRVAAARPPGPPTRCTQPQSARRPLARPMTLAAAARGVLGRAARQAAQHQQRRSVGDLPVKPNRFVEEWSTRREHIEDEFRWDGRTLLNLGLFVGLVPYLVYVGGVAEFNTVDKLAGRPPRDMWGSDGAAR